MKTRTFAVRLDDNDNYDHIKAQGWAIEAGGVLAFFVDGHMLVCYSAGQWLDAVDQDG